jgi:hypothetical protein
MSAPIIPPLDDPDYEPVHQPINGRPPEVIAKWGAASQLRWFRRFWDELGDRNGLVPEAVLAPFYCHSAYHRGPCCNSCMSDQEDGYYYTDSCCCRADRA